jgi:urease accessory protein
MTRMGESTIRWVGLGALAGILCPAGAHAHLVDARFGDFYAGLIHPLTALEHVFPIVAVGLLAGQQGAKNARLVLGVFAAALLVGVVLGKGADGTQLLIYVNGASFVVVGGLVAIARRLPAWVLTAVAGLFGLSHGYANGAAMRPEMAVLNFDAGVVSAGLVVVSLGAGIVLSLERPWSKVAVRVVGSWIAAIGMMTLALM